MSCGVTPNLSFDLRAIFKALVLNENNWLHSAKYILYQPSLEPIATFQFDYQDLKEEKHPVTRRIKSIMATLPCIIPNPDIAGVGVRLSVYIQAFLNLVAVAMFSRGGLISQSDYKGLITTSNNLFITGCAILAFSIVQGTTHGLSVYHALIVLNLGWINSLSAIHSLIIAYTKMPMSKLEVDETSYKAQQKALPDSTCPFSSALFTLRGWEHLVFGSGRRFPALETNQNACPQPF